MVFAREVGRVMALVRYPVKSMAGCPVGEADMSWHGLDGDRRWAFVREAQARSGFPWLTLRERADLTGYQPSFVEPHRPNASVTVVRTPGGQELEVIDPQLAAELAPAVRVLKQDRGVFDTFPLSLITMQTIESLGAHVGTPLEVARFRPNLVVDARTDATFPEDEWVGRVLRIGGARMRIDKRDQRCVVVNLHPITATRNAEVLRAIARERAGALGVYGTTVEPGHVTVGDAVVLESA